MAEEGDEFGEVEGVEWRQLASRGELKRALVTCILCFLVAVLYGLSLEIRTMKGRL
jgi:hypothetical protein